MNIRRCKAKNEAANVGASRCTESVRQGNGRGVKVLRKKKCNSTELNFRLYNSFDLFYKFPKLETLVNKAFRSNEFFSRKLLRKVKSCIGYN